MTSRLESRLQEVIEEARAHVAEHGYYVQSVGGGQGEPSFTYSAGLQKNLGHPEIVMVGFSPDLCRRLIYDMTARIRAGERFDRPQKVDKILTDFDVAIRPLSDETVKANTGFGQTVVGSSFEAVQMYLPDPKGLFPWDDGCNPQYVKLQTGPFQPEGQLPGASATHAPSKH